MLAQSGTDCNGAHTDHEIYHRGHDDGTQAQGKGLCIYRTQATYSGAHKTLRGEKKKRKGEQEEGEQEPSGVVGHVTPFADPIRQALTNQTVTYKNGNDESVSSRAITDTYLIIPVLVESVLISLRPIFMNTLSLHFSHCSACIRHLFGSLLKF